MNFPLVPPTKSVSMVPVTLPDEFDRLFEFSYHNSRLCDLLVDASTLTAVERIVKEIRQQARLKEHGLSATKKLILVGPRGVGKRKTAETLSCELSCPLFRMKLTREQFNREPSLRLIFDTIVHQRAVYLFDNFNLSLWSLTRMDFIRFLDNYNSDSVIVFTTEEEVSGVFEPYDKTSVCIVNYSLPSDDIKKKLIENRLAFFGGAKLNFRKILKGTKKMSHGDIVQVCENSMKYAIVENKKSVDTEDFMYFLSRCVSYTSQ